MRQLWQWLVLAIVLVAVLGYVYVRTHPLVFMKAHQHCIKFAGMEFMRYASNHDGKFPYDPKGYGNALLLMDEECFHVLTGPGYYAGPFREAKRTGRDLPEEECGRVYVQGLSVKSDYRIVVLFDKLPTPGGDHCHFPMRMWIPLGREVLLRDGSMRYVPETEWEDFAKEQIELLVLEGIKREEAERLYASQPKPDAGRRSR